MVALVLVDASVTIKLLIIYISENSEIRTRFVIVYDDESVKSFVLILLLELKQLIKIASLI